MLLHFGMYARGLAILALILLLQQHSFDMPELALGRTHRPDANMLAVAVWTARIPTALALRPAPPLKKGARHSVEQELHLHSESIFVLLDQVAEPSCRRANASNPP